MKLELLNDLTDSGKFPLADPGKLLRLYDFDFSELIKLKLSIEQNLIKSQKELELSKLDFVDSLNCTLVLKLSLADSGIKYPADFPDNFVGLFSKESYNNMLEIIENLTKNGNVVNGFNWLYEPSNTDQIDLLISSGGSW